ncbi:LacI family DNA-binding transcriptional regulator (plasmid) [Qingshengfaniella alkalisoli]|uniref:LacI family DNA-binding transcriptional regulator n=1 Tax=Qingshengfaniella alkalisoli TaxID=2599296 RepID=A0A5B8IXS8_9RHOB|nr:LacI family DNA-binding transcriptional regulator [Qingshengfaniella alkalisoli]
MARPKIKDVATLAGVSTATVSRALSAPAECGAGHPRKGHAGRERNRLPGQRCRTRPAPTPRPVNPHPGSEPVQHLLQPDIRGSPGRGKCGGTHRPDIRQPHRARPDLVAWP